jgi:hypothetical protein
MLAVPYLGAMALKPEAIADTKRRALRLAVPYLGAMALKPDCFLAYRLRMFLQSPTSGRWR